MRGIWPAIMTTVTDPQFRSDLYQGAARDYERFRLGYPQSLIEDLRRRVPGTGRLLDLACGTGQLSFALRGSFAQIWAVDQEPDMIAVVREKALASGAEEIHAEVAAAESADLPTAAFDLVAIGNAFHRMRRDTVAGNAARWLRPGGYLALVWGGSPFPGDAPWQRALHELMERWQQRALAHTGGAARVPAGWEQARATRPDRQVLAEAGFEPAGHWQFWTEKNWAPDELCGFLFATAGLTRLALADLAPEFERDLRTELGAYTSDGRLRQLTDFEYELARRP
jgi:SAM-dependent methyltransferase